MFSDKCVEELLKAGYKPEWLGSYNHVSKQIQAAKKKCQDHDQPVASGSSSKPPEPSADDRYLASCQSGHLSQNACFQEQGARGDPCRNTVDGHHDAHYPCMPQSGHAQQEGGEHCAATNHERDSAGAQGRPGQPYPPGQLARDSNDRGKMIADTPKLATDNGRRPIARDSSGGPGGRGGGSTSTGGTAGGTGATGRPPPDPNKKWTQEITGETAGDCINAFREAGEAAMRAKCVEERHKNREIANGGPGRNAEQGRQHRSQLQEEARAARARAAANPNDKKAPQEARAASAAYTRARNAHCMANQGVRLAQGRGRNNPIIPSNARSTGTGTVGLSGTAF